MKKVISIALSGILALGILTGCEGASSVSSTVSKSETANSTAAVSSTKPAAAKEAQGFDTAMEITVVSREEGSGTRGAFIELVGVEEKDANGEKIDHTSEEAVTVSSTSIVMTTVSGDPYAIGYISMGSLNNTVKALEIDGVAPTAENIKSGSYAISRPFNIATKEGLSEVASDFIAFIMSSEGQKVVEDSGYIAVENAAKLYAGGKPSGKVVVAGSSSVTPVMEKLQEAYKLANPNAEVEVQMSDSSTGMSSTIDGICDIGMASRALKDSELEAGLTPKAIAMDGIAVIVNPANPTAGLSSESVKSIFVGETLTWDAA